MSSILNCEFIPHNSEKKKVTSVRYKLTNVRCKHGIARKKTSELITRSSEILIIAFLFCILWGEQKTELRDVNSEENKNQKLNSLAFLINLVEQVKMQSYFLLI